MNNIEGKSSIFYLPDDFVCYVDDERGAVSFLKFEAVFSKVKDQIVFSVCIDDTYWINEKFKLTDDVEKKAFFGKSPKGKQYSSIHERVAAVYTAVCTGKIKLEEEL